MNTTDIDLHKTPLREWPAEAVIEMSNRAARYWRNQPAFFKHAGHLYSNPEDRASEIVSRVLERLQTEKQERYFDLHHPDSDSVDQVSLFFAIAKYVRPAMVIESYSIPSRTTGQNAGDEDNDTPKEIVDSLTTEMQEAANKDSERVMELLTMVGVSDKHFALFENSVKDLEEGLGISERKITDMRSEYSREFAERAQALGVWDELMGFLGVKPSQINEVRPRNSKAKAKAVPKKQTVKIFYHTIKTGLTLAQQSEIDALRFHWVGPDEYEVRQWEPGGRWEYRCRVFVEAGSDTMDMDKVFKAFKGLA
ncbi:hypothetical protein THIX_30729 [Thiomonas sp. X19]|uniref:hypothetical protein n=1 Tax=Thiomonas sp. X19 TaxID=1050370 RepID=UPI000B62C2F1|nr:hypothetical protein [Thiomonas sp. X19]SCC93501.1 hypothetical protein THIX_30729 [Thiomonas sp. X19]